MDFQLLDGKVWLLKELKESQGEQQNVAIAAVTNVSTSAIARPRPPQKPAPAVEKRPSARS
jgi:hypothetical protein